MVTMGGYPGTASLTQGTLVVQAHTGLLRIYGYVTGLGADVMGGWHVHEGFSCSSHDDIGGHYYSGLNDPWTNTEKYSTDNNGVAEVSLAVPGFSLDDEMPVAGRAIVFHSAGGGLVGCGVITPTTAEVALIGTYPAYAGATAVRGVLALREVSGGLTVSGTLTGLQADAQGGWHVHAGFSCESVDSVFGHFLSTGGSDPWSGLTYSSDQRGVAQVDAVVSGTSLHMQDMVPSFGRAVVVHEDNAAANNPRSGCGVVGGSFGVTSAVAFTEGYPGYSGSYQEAKVMAWLSEVSGELTMHAVLTGLEPNAMGGFHIHSGFSCASADLVGGHYYPGLSLDPWLSSVNPSWQYQTDAQGVAVLDLTLSDFSLEGLRAVAGRTMVAHLSGGARVACGVIMPAAAEAVLVSEYPTYTGSQAGYSVGGLLAVWPTSVGVRINGVLTGLETAVTGGWHVHAGYSCAEHVATSGHYLAADGMDPWKVPVATEYTSDAKGVASVDVSVGKVSVYGAMPVYGRAVVVHHSTALGTSRAGCGVIGASGLEHTALSMMTPYPTEEIEVVLTASAFVRYFNYFGALVVAGSVGPMRTSGTSQTFGFSLSGLDTACSAGAGSAGNSCGLHVHTGISCSSDAGGHYFTGAVVVDPWATVGYTSTPTGTASGSLSVETGAMQQSLIGKAVIVHSFNGSRIACAILTAPTPAPTVAALPVSGMVTLSSTPTSGLRVRAVVSGLEPSTSGGWHVHVGFSCASDTAVGGHFFPGLAADPWTTTSMYHTDSNGVAVIDEEIPDFTVAPGQARSVGGRTIVFHKSSAAGSGRAGCGEIEMYSGGHADLIVVGSYPSYAGSRVGDDVRGMLLAQDSAGGVNITGVITGMRPDSVGGGWHVHAGYSCADHVGVFGHYMAADGTDPWKVPLLTFSEFSERRCDDSAFS